MCTFLGAQTFNVGQNGETGISGMRDRCGVAKVSELILARREWQEGVLTLVGINPFASEAEICGNMRKSPDVKPDADN